MMMTTRSLFALLFAALALSSFAGCLPTLQTVFSNAGDQFLLTHKNEAPLRQLRYDTEPGYWLAEEGVGHFSEWSKDTKRMFVDDVRAGKANEWIVVMGNEGGDLDSMTAALTWAYHLSHVSNLTKSGASTLGHAHPTKVIALLQTPEDALDLRPENKLALHNVRMSPGHRDLLTIDELPMDAEELAPMLHGIVIVDHPEPLRVWAQARLLSIFDHHKDRGIAPNARPRLFEATASCTTIVARQMLDELEKLSEEYHVPHEILELILDAIALDSAGLRRGTPEDKFTARRLLKRSNFRGEKLLEVMDRLGKDMSMAKRDLEDLSVRDLLRRDWKGDLVNTRSQEHSVVHLGLASIPYSLEEQMQRTLHGQVQSWFDIEQQWTKEIAADISLSLNSFKVKVKREYALQHNLAIEEEVSEEAETDEGVRFVKVKTREIALVVRASHSHRLDEAAADSLFEVIKAAIDEEEVIDAKPWHRQDELVGRQMVWTHHIQNGGRKLIRPIVEDAVRSWSG